MCQVYNGDSTGVIHIRRSGTEGFIDRYGEDIGEKAYKKMRNKLTDCTSRGIEFKITWEVLDLLIDKLVLCQGFCDYTGESFVDESNHISSPTLERIDSNLPYQEGNLCVITKQINSLKGRIESDQGCQLTIKEDERELFNKMFRLIVSPKDIEKIRNQYIPKRQEKQMTTEVEIPSKDVPEDIQLSKVYYTLMNFFVQQNKSVVITFAQFRRLYKFKKCFLSGTVLTEDNKSPIILGEEVNKDTLRFAVREYAVPFQSLIDQKGMTATLLKNMLDKNL